MEIIKKRADYDVLLCKHSECRTVCLLRLQHERFHFHGGAESTDDLDRPREFCNPPPFRCIFTRLGRENMVSMLGGLEGRPPSFPNFDGK